MKALAFFCLILLRLSGASAQVTIVKGAPNRVFDLACAQCTLSVEDIAVWKGVRPVSYNKEKTGLVNLLHWKYYDSIMKAEVTTDTELPWEKCTQLLDAVRNNDTVSLQINLSWTDSSAQTHRIYLLVSGLVKSNLSAMPLYCAVEADSEFGLKHFSATAQIRPPDGKTETYETISGEMTLIRFDARTGAVSGTFEFEGNCIGWVKRGTFTGGYFEKK